VLPSTAMSECFDEPALHQKHADDGVLGKCAIIGSIQTREYRPFHLSSRGKVKGPGGAFFRGRREVAQGRYCQQS